MIMFKNKNKARNIIPVPEESIVAEDMSTVTKENINVVNEEVKVTKKRTNKNKKACRIIVAKPNYFVIEKDGEKIRIDKKNKYRRGDEVIY